MSGLNGFEMNFKDLMLRIAAKKAQGVAPDRRYEDADFVLLAQVADHDMAHIAALADDLRQEMGNGFLAIYLLDRIREETELGSTPRTALERMIKDLQLSSDRLRFRMAHSGQLARPQDDDAA